MDNQTQNTTTPATPEVAPAVTAAPVAEAPASTTEPVATTDTAAAQPAPEAAVPQVTQTERIFATVGYVGPLFILPLVAQPKSEFCKFHARQSMGLLGFFFLQLIILAIVPVIGSLITFVIFAAYILSMYNAYMGRLWKVPVLGAIAQKIDFDKFLAQAGAGVANMSAVKEKAAGLTDVVGSAVESVTNKANEDVSKPSEK